MYLQKTKKTAKILRFKVPSCGDHRETKNVEKNKDVSP